jgi:cyclic beta-1,2-glucan synthetase
VAIVQNGIRSWRLSRPQWSARRGRPSTAFGDEPPLRAELFSSEQLAKYGKVLATSHRLSGRRGADGLLERPTENETVLASVRDLLTDGVNTDRRITPAGEWLLDNFYLIEEPRTPTSFG